jgi:chromosome partitioning protein
LVSTTSPITPPAEPEIVADEQVVEQAPTVRRHPLPRVMAVANQKGGVGKTTTAINVGAALAELGLRVLIVDLDPQANASSGLDIDPRGLEVSMYQVLMHDVPLENCVEPTDVKGLFVAPASLDLAGAEIELVPAFSRETRLSRAIDTVVDEYDYVLIDCPPSLGLLTVNGLSAAREVLVPIQCEYYALEGLRQLLLNVDRVRRHLNPQLDVSTVVCVMYDARTNLSEQVVRELRAHPLIGDKVLSAVVPRSVRLSEAPSHGQPILIYDPRSRGAIAYRDVAKEIHDESSQRTG